MFRPRIILCMLHITYLHNYRHHHHLTFRMCVAAWAQAVQQMPYSCAAVLTSSATLQNTGTWRLTPCHGWPPGGNIEWHVLWTRYWQMTCTWTLWTGELLVVFLATPSKKPIVLSGRNYIIKSQLSHSHLSWHNSALQDNLTYTHARSRAHAHAHTHNNTHTHAMTHASTRTRTHARLHHRPINIDHPSLSRGLCRSDAIGRHGLELQWIPE